MIDLGLLKVERFRIDMSGRVIGRKSAIAGWPAEQRLDPYALSAVRCPLSAYNSHSSSSHRAASPKYKSLAFGPAAS